MHCFTSTDVDFDTYARLTWLFRMSLGPLADVWCTCPNIRTLVSSSMFGFCSRRMSSMALRHPDKIFTTIPPPPPSWSILDFSQPLTSPSKRAPWTRSGPDGYGKTADVLKRLQHALRCVHKRKILWQDEISCSSKCVFLATPSHIHKTYTY